MTLTLTTSQALVLYLSQQKSECFDGSIRPLIGGVFGIYGHGNVAGIGEALWQYQDRIPYFRGQNEQGMGHAAVAYAKAMRGRALMAVTTSIGPGATNLVTTAALAHTNRLPLLLLPGDIYASRRPDPVLQQLEDPSCPMHSVNDTLKPASRYFDRIMRPEQLLQSLPQAMRTLTSPLERGPVTLALPQDVQAECYEYPKSFFEETVHYLQRPRPDRRQVQRFAAAVRAAKRPLIIAGGGIHYSGAEEALRKFAENHHLPVAETCAGKTSLPFDHPLCVGAVGVTGNSAANALAANADLIIAIGTRLGDFTTASKSLFKGNIATLNISAYDGAKGSCSLLCDALEGIEELGIALNGYQRASLVDVHAALAQWSKDYEQATAAQGTATDAQVVRALNESVPDEAIVVCAAGGLPGEFNKLWRSRDPVSFHLEYAYSCMGYEIAGGLGAKMAFPDREVYVLVGDGSYLMMHSELLTARLLGMKITLVLVDNGGFGCINRLQKACGSPPYGNLFGCGSVDFVQNAASYGCFASKAENIEELKVGLQQAAAQDTPCVIVINTDPEQSSPGYAWWDVAVAEHSSVTSISAARKNYEQKIKELI